MRQLTLAGVSFDKHSKQTRRGKFLAEMDQVVPWRGLCAAVAPFYPRAGTGRPPIGLERMLRLHFLQHWFNLSDPAAEEAFYDSLSMRRFVGIDLGREPVPDETTILNFRHLLERHNLSQLLFDRVNQHLASRGLAALSSMPRSSRPRVRPRMKRRRAIRRCTRRGRVSNGTSA
jgi:transposase, IS5 family